MTEDRGDQPRPDAPPPRNAEIGSLLRCTRCELNYTASKSTSALRLTYCSFLCELGDLGFSMAGLEHMQRKPRTDTTDPAPEPVGTSA